MKKGCIEYSILGLGTARILLVILFISFQPIVGSAQNKPVQKTKTIRKPAKQPKFIKGLYLSAHVKVCSTINAIDQRIPPPPPKPAIQVPPAPPEIVQTDTTSQALTNVKVKKPGKGKGKKKKAAIEPQVVANVPETPTTIPVVDSLPQLNAPLIDMSTDYATCMRYTDMVGIKCEEMANIQLYKFIDKWYGTDYRLGGQSERGIDCSGFTQKLYGEVYSTELTRTAQDQYRNAERSKHSEEAEEGDLVFFKQRGKRITHVGVYLANDFFVHSSTSSGVVISNLNEDYWRKHYVGIGKIQKGEKPMTITSAEEETQAAH